MYPYYIYPDVMALREGTLDSEEAIQKARRRIAVNVGDMRALRIIFGLDPEEFGRFYPDMVKPDLSTTDTIDSFLLQFGKEQAPVSQAAAEIPQTEAPKTMADAQLLIKNHDYEAALEIIIQQSLNNPKKSIYFADQIRFLRKLILNKSKQNNQ